MLILSRKRGQSIMIGDEVEVRVVDIGDGKVRLGVTSPAWVPVHQRERYEAKRRDGASTAPVKAERVLVR